MFLGTWRNVAHEQLGVTILSIILIIMNIARVISSHFVLQDKKSQVTKPTLINLVTDMQINLHGPDTEYLN
jgi:hypothetical protein